MPLGTGPYVFSKLGASASLRRRNNWWCNPDMVITADNIPLIPAESINQIRDNFQFGGLDVVCADPGSDRYADYRSDFELWDCENGIFLYMVFSSYSDIFENNELQAAVTYAIDRELLVSEHYRGFAQAASLPASPSFPYYSPTLAKRYDYEPEKFAEAVQKANLGDAKVRILVNSKDSLRTRVAQDICEMLEAGGMQTELVAVSGDTYKYTLNAWDFDIYLGQTILSPNMDLSPYFFMYGTLKQGGTTDLAAYALCLQALENHGNYYTLHQDVMDRGLICPILFRSYAVYATRGLVTDLTPARDNIFYYSLGKTMETARLQ
jgi:ABC-type transport system substrate-binding protein